MSISTAPSFVVDTPLQSLLEPYPEPGQFREILSAVSRRGREILVRLWLTEGIPFAFRQCPAVYDELRVWLGSRLEVHPKQITLLGSGRIGFSLASPPKFGRAFGEHSDLDFSIVSLELFQIFEQTFHQFERDYAGGSVQPRHETERRYWNDNLVFGRRNLPKGFFDADKVPRFHRYPVSQRVGDAMSRIINMLATTPNAPKVPKASIRVYRDWQSLVERASFNLHWVVRAQSGA
jgi:hypothetical protein